MYTFRWCFQKLREHPPRGGYEFAAVVDTDCRRGGYRFSAVVDIINQS
jgi:hypothetical protein